jgi:hypothetical protein
VGSQLNASASLPQQEASVASAAEKEVPLRLKYGRSRINEVCVLQIHDALITDVSI